MKKVLYITYYWPPSGGAGVQRGVKFVKYLPQFNIQPFVLTVDEKFASYPTSDYSLQNEIASNIKVYKTKSFEPLSIIGSVFGKSKIPHAGFANHKKEKLSSIILRFIRGNFFIPDARVGWVNYAYKKAVEIIDSEKIETVVISSPPHSSQLIGLKLKKRFPSLKWIADLRDPWTDIYFYKDMLHTGLAKQKDSNYEKEVLKQADKIVVVSNEIKKSFEVKQTACKGKIHVIPNGFDEDDFKNLTSEKSTNEFVLSYVGTLSETYNPEIFIKALASVKERLKDRKIKLRFVGSVSSQIVTQIKSNNLHENFEHIPYVEHAEALKYLLTSDVLLLIIPEVENDKGILTGKLFEYLASKKVIVGIGPEDGNAAEIINECNAGKMFSRNNVNAEKIAAFLINVANGSVVRSDNQFAKYERKNLAGELAKLL